jgi:hypothetical protein
MTHYTSEGGDHRAVLAFQQQWITPAQDAVVTRNFVRRDQAQSAIGGLVDLE